MATFPDVQLRALASFGRPHPADHDVRKWPAAHRHDLFSSSDRVTIFLQSATATKLVCTISRFALTAVSPVFAEHLLQDPEMVSFTFEVGGMDEASQEDHTKGIEALYLWLFRLTNGTVADLEAIDFYSEISLRHIARQLGMRAYLPEDTTDLIDYASVHVLQPWQVTELLYAISISIDSKIPVVKEDDPLLIYLATRNTEVSKFLEDLEEYYEWLSRPENRPLYEAIVRVLDQKPWDQQH